MEVLAGVPSDGGLGTIFGNMADPAWQRAASATEVAAILERLADDIAAGGDRHRPADGLRAGRRPGRVPRGRPSSPRRPAFRRSPTAATSPSRTPTVRIDGAEEVVRAAGETGAHMHYCHINSTSTRHIDRVHRLVERCRADGATVTTEAYPYGSGSTAIGAAFLSPERLAARGLDPTT